MIKANIYEHNSFIQKKDSKVNTENCANNSNTIRTLKNVETNEELLNKGRQLIKDNPSDITLNINDFLEQQEEFLRSYSLNTLRYNTLENKFARERKLKYPINNPNCPLYIRYMNILKHDYSNYSNSDLLDLYEYSHKNNVKIRRKDLLKIATIDGKVNCGIDF